MSGDYSRKIFNRQKHYSGVLMQQGRVQLDSDWNEQLDVQLHRTHTEAIDVIGSAGVPKNNDGFKIGVTANARDLTIAPGRFYLDGLLCELEEQANYSAQPYFPNPAFAVPASSPPSSPPSSVLQLTDGTYLVFLDAWQREVTALVEEHKLIREVALGGPDTTTRLQNVWQIRLLRVGNLTSPPSSPPGSPPGSPPQGTFTCTTQFPQLDQITAPSTGTLNARTVEPQPEDDPCLLPPSAGYSRLENQLYRVEIQTAGPGTPTFKWSRDNASVETTVESIAGSVVIVRDTGKDEVLGFAGGQWVEVIDEESTLKNIARPLVQIDKVDLATRQITMKSSMAQFAQLPGLRIRRWDQTTGANAVGVVATPSTWIDLEGGVQVNFSAGTYHVGDYWLIPARTATREIEWPPFQIPNQNPIAQPPRGINHHYARLALVESQGGLLSVVADCRTKFPPLNDICAEDVCFDNNGCLAELADAQTVQEALEVLCKKREDGCTFVAIPGADLQALFDSIPTGGDAQICFQTGTYQLPATVNVRNKGHIKLSGCGPGTRLIAAQSEAAMIFEACKSVLIRDLYAETRAVDSRAGTPTEGLRGTLTFTNCNAVDVQTVAAKCGAAAVRAATCITVSQPLNNPSPVRIQHCDLSVGHQQTGILLVNVQRAHVEDNLIRVYAKPDSLRIPSLIQDLTARAHVRRLFISGAHLGPTPPPGGRTNVTLTAGNQVIHFKTHTSLRSAWPQLLQANPAVGVNSPRALLGHVTRLADRILLEPALRNTVPAFRTFFDGLLLQDRGVASQGVTVGGETSSEVRITNNTIEGVLQGIHVGLSRHAVRGSHNIAGVVNIQGNTIAIVLPAEAGKRDRHGIFVGNCRSLLIENNDVRLERLPQADTFLVEGIRVWGVLGDRALITANHLASADGVRTRSFDTGIRVNPLANLKPAASLWLVTLNSAPSKQATVSVANGAVASSNVP
jgi:hypothetical protein